MTHAGTLSAHYHCIEFQPELADQRGYKGPGWYFYDETEAWVIGPFETQEEADNKRLEYEP